MIVVSFWTKGTPYEQEAVELVKTLDRFGLFCDVQEYEHPGSWLGAGRLIPSVIYQARVRHPADDLLYVDADARFMQDPRPACASLAARCCDLGLYSLPGSRHAPKGQCDEICTGTSWWAPTDGAEQALKCWLSATEAVAADPENKATDQVILQGVLPEIGKVARIGWLDPSMCWMDRVSAAHFGDRVAPVIYHTQASRRHQRVVNRA